VDIKISAHDAFLE